MLPITVEPGWDDGAAYHAFMGRWSRAAGDVFLEWLAPPRDARWLEVGCGTGAFTELVLDRCSPASMSAVDPATDQLDHARKRLAAHNVDFRLADAQALPFPDHSFDTLASALVINFIPDRPRAIVEMLRVCLPEGRVGGYVWDFMAGRSPTWPLASAVAQMGLQIPRMPGTEVTAPEALRELFEHAGFHAVEVRSIDVSVSFANFENYWRTQVVGFHPLGKIITSMSDADRTSLSEIVRATLPLGPDGSISYSACATAIKARAPARLGR